MSEETARYQPFYCEENIWQLCAQRSFDAERAWAVFISNPARTCALWSQRAARRPGEPVLWDYHVVLLDTSEAEPRIWDLDTLIGTPAPFADWWQATFPFEDRLPEQFQPRFRLIPADVYLAEFSSDRSHMRDEQGAWRAPPPEWAPIFDADRGMNLDRFIDLEDEFVGEVMGREGFCRFVGVD